MTPQPACVRPGTVLAPTETQYRSCSGCGPWFSLSLLSPKMHTNPRRFLLSFIAALSLGAIATLSAQTAKKPVVGFSQIGSESGWRTANTDSIKSEAAKRGIELKFSDAQQKQENQIKALRSFIAQGVDVIAFSPVVETGFEPVLKEIKAAGIPVVLSDRAVKVSEPNLYVTFIG